MYTHIHINISVTHFAGSIDTRGSDTAIKGGGRTGERRDGHTYIYIYIYTYTCTHIYVICVSLCVVCRPQGRPQPRFNVKRVYICLYTHIYRCISISISILICI